MIISGVFFSILHPDTEWSKLGPIVQLLCSSSNHGTMLYATNYKIMTVIKRWWVLDIIQFPCMWFPWVAHTQINECTYTHVATSMACTQWPATHPPPPQWNVIHWYSGQHRQKAQQKKCNVLWGWIMPSCVHELCTTGAPRSLRCSLIVKPQITTPQSPCVWELDSGGARNELHIQI